MITQEMTALDWWIAATMTWHPQLAQRLEARGVSRDDLMLKRAAMVVDGLRFPLQISRDDALRYFGSPDMKSADRLLYALVLWPEHLYDIEFGGDGKVSDLGFRRADESQQLDGKRVRETPGAALRPWYHTAHDIESVLGRPTQEREWWPGRTVQYQLDGAKLVTLAYDHELLVSVGIGK
jgi:hypothetical protein